MKFNEKLTKLRKEKGMTQEDLAFEVGVSRQSVSKWETGEAEPNLSTVKELARIFEVSVDCLIGEEENGANAPFPTEKRVNQAEAIAFLAATRKVAKWIALGVFLCILSPVCLILLGAMSEIPKYGVSEGIAGGVGMIVLLLLVAIAVALFIVCDGKTSPFDHLVKESFQTEDDARKSVQKERDEYRRKYTVTNIVGASLCILSLVPLFIGVILNENDDMLIVSMLAILFVIAGTGVFFFVVGGVIWGAYEKLLQTGEYTKERKERITASTTFSTVYWLLATALFLAISLPENEWKYSGLVWVFAGVLYPATLAIFQAIQKRK